MKRILVTLIVLGVCTYTHAESKTEIVVKKGIVKTTTDQGDSLIRRGQKAILKKGQQPNVDLNNEIVKTLLTLEEQIQKERQNSDLDIQYSSAQVFSVDEEDLWKIGVLMTMPNRQNQASDTCRIGPTSILNDMKCFDLQGRLLEYKIEPIDNSKGYIYLKFHSPVAQGDGFRYIMISDFQPKTHNVQLIGKIKDQWIVSAANDTRNCLNYFHVILPTSAIYVKAEPEVCQIGQTEDRVSVTIRNYTGPEANGRFRVYFLWPGKDGESLTNLKVIPWTNAGSEVVDIYNMFIDENIQSPELWGELAIKLVGGRFYEEAYDAFERCYNGHESAVWDYTALTWQGHLHDLWGRRQEAITKYQKALDIKPAKRDMRHDQWGIVLTKQWLNDRLQTPFNESMYELAGYYETLKEKFENIPWKNGGPAALEVYHDVLESGLPEAKGWMYAGIKLVGAGYFDEALDCFQRAETGGSTRVYRFTSLIWQGHLLDIQGQREKAIEKYYQALEMKDDEVGKMRHDQWSIVLTKDWVRQRLESPFTVEMLK